MTNLVVGCDVAIRLELKQPNGSALDITGYVFSLTVKQDADQADAQALVAIDWSSHTNAAGGITSVTIPASATVNLVAGKSYVYDVTYRTPSNTKHQVVPATIFKPKQRVTHR